MALIFVQTLLQNISKVIYDKSPLSLGLPSVSKMAWSFWAKPQGSQLTTLIKVFLTIFLKIGGTGLAGLLSRNVMF